MPNRPSTPRSLTFARARFSMQNLTSSSVSSASSGAATGSTSFYTRAFTMNPGSRDTVKSTTYLPGTRIQVTRVFVVTHNGIALCQQRHHTSRQLLLLCAQPRAALLIIQEHVYIFHSILQDAPAPLDFVKEQLRLQTARDLQRRAAVVQLEAVRRLQLALDLCLNGGLRMSSASRLTEKDKRAAQGL